MCMAMEHLDAGHDKWDLPATGDRRLEPTDGSHCGEIINGFQLSEYAVARLLLLDEVLSR